MKNINKINPINNCFKRVITKFVSAVLAVVLFGTAFGDVKVFNGKAYNTADTAVYAAEGDGVVLQAINKNKIDQRLRACRFLSDKRYSAYERRTFLRQ